MQPSSITRGPRTVFRLLAVLLLIVGAAVAAEQARAQSDTFAANAQHTAGYSPPAQHLDVIRWSAVIDFDNSGALAHYGAPLITASNTVLVPVKITNGFVIKAFDGPSGRLKYTLTNDFVPPPLPANSWISTYQPVIANPPSGPRLYYPGAGGTVYYTENLDSDTPSVPIQQCFYASLDTYHSNAASFNSNVVINTPLTAGTNGAVFFGFRMQDAAPAPLNTTNGGFVRIDPAGNATYVLAGTAAGDTGISRDSHNCAPALSNDGSTLYVAAKNGASAYYAYLLGLDSTTLATKYKTLLRDPRNNSFAGVVDISTASPMVAPDGDVYFGIFGNPNNGSRGFLLRFSADLQTKKTPSAFGWDYTAAIIPTNMVPSYSGTSSYLLFTKYNNYAGNGDGDGINKIALLDPNTTETDPHPSAGGISVMREVLTVNGCTTDSEYFGSTYPYAVREWCINTAVVNPATRSVFAPCEDGRIYRWNLASNSLTETLNLGSGVGEPYVPTVIGPDGSIYTLNGGKLFAIGAYTNLAISVFSSAPDLRTVVAGQPVTFTAVVTNLNASDPAPSGALAFQDVTYRSLTRITNILAGAVPLSNGVASVTVSNLVAGSNYLGNHFITAIYSGDTNFSAARSTLVQKIHASASTTTLYSSATSSGAPVTFTTVVSPSVSGGSKPTGMVCFRDGSTVLAQIPLRTNGTAAFTTSGPAATSSAITASYLSDTMFAASSTGLVVVPPVLGSFTILSNGGFRFGFSNIIGAPFTVLGATDLFLPFNNWPVLGPATEVTPGQFQFTDVQATNYPQQFYRVRSP